MISRFFIDRPIFATVLSVVITLIGGISLYYLPIAQYPRITPPGISVSISYPGASAQVVADTVAAPIEQQVNGVEGMLYMSSQMGNDGIVHPDGHLRHRHRPEHGPGHGAEPRDAGHAAVADPGAEPGDHDPQEDARHVDDRQLLLAGRPLRRHLPEQLRHDLRQGRAAARLRGLGHQLPGPARLQHPRLARPAEAGGAEHDRHGRGQRDPHAERRCARRPDRPAPRLPGPALPVADRHPGPAHQSGAVRRHRRQGRPERRRRAGDRHRPAPRCGPRRAGRPELQPVVHLRRPARRWA